MKSTSQPMAEATEFHINRPLFSYSRYCLKERARHLHGHDDHHSRRDRHRYHHHSSP
ncbi:hypothetical protein Hanom_Chr12g01162091 [Helianthus anomalus]